MLSVGFKWLYVWFVGKILTQHQVIGTSAASLTTTSVRGAGRGGQRVTLTSHVNHPMVKGQVPRQPGTVTISSLIAAQKQPSPSMFKIQGSNVLQTIGGKPLTVQKTGQGGKPGHVIGSSGQVISQIKSNEGKPVQITAGNTQQVTDGV